MCRLILGAVAMLLPLVHPSPTGAQTVLPSPSYRCDIQQYACTHLKPPSPYTRPGDQRYRIQAAFICGANCWQTYTVTHATTGAELLTLRSWRGAFLAERVLDGAVVQLVAIDGEYDPGTPGCCPDRLSVTTYTWDGTQGVLRAAPPVIRPSVEVDLPQTIERLRAEGFRSVLP